MALNAERIEFHIQRIINAEFRTFSGSIKQLFNYLGKEASDNKEYIRYENEREKWENWPPGPEGRLGVNWSIPDDFEEAKSLAYYLYKSAGEQNDQGPGISFHLFRQPNRSDNVYKFNQTFEEYFVKSLKDILHAEQNLEDVTVHEPMGNKIFIVHGQDNEMKREVQLLLTRAGLDDVVLHERPDRGRTIIDKLIQESKDACYVIALLSPDDELANGSSRARQNVIFEIGYFLGKLGKERVRLFKRGNIDIPSDLQGILYENYDTEGNWRMKILKEMKAFGVEINVDKVLEKY